MIMSRKSRLGCIFNYRVFFNPKLPNLLLVEALIVGLLAVLVVSKFECFRCERAEAEASLS